MEHPAEAALRVGVEDGRRRLFEDVLETVVKRQRWLMDRVDEQDGAAVREAALNYTTRAIEWLLEVRRGGQLRCLEGDEALETWQCDETALINS